MRGGGLSVLTQGRTLLLLADDTAQPLGNFIGEHHARERNLGIGALDEALQFAARPGEVLTRDQLLNAAWGVEYKGTTRTLDQHVAQLRKKIEADPKAPRYLQTVRGSGYMLAPD